MGVVQQHIDGSKIVADYIQQKKVLYIVEISLDIDYTGIVGISVAGYMLSWKVASMFT